MVEPANFGCAAFSIESTGTNRTTHSIIQKNKNYMKRIIISLTPVLAAAVLHAQSADQGFHQLYYERYQSAEQSFQQAVHQNANDAPAWYGLTRTYLLENETANAENKIHSAPASVQNEPYFEVAYGSLMLNE